MDRRLSPDRRADLLAAQLLQAEKINLATGVSGCVNAADGYVAGSARLGLPDLTFVGAGMGVSGGICPNRANGGRATLLPAPIAMAASWDPSVAYEDGALIGRETRATGFNISIGGDVNLVRDPRSGRTFEGEGEDPLLAGEMVGAQLRGTQAQHVVATIKHFAFNNEEKFRLTASSQVDDRTMRELELRAFEVGLARSGAGAVMCSYNKVNGAPACQNKHLLTDVLKRDWGFPGWVMTDWWACTPPAVYDSADQCTTAEAALAGLDQQQPNASFFGPALLAAVAQGKVPQARLDDMVHRILRSLFAAGVIDDPPIASPLDAAAGANVSQRVAERSAVLLKNDRAALPLDRNAVRSIAVIGAPADKTPPAPGSPLAVPPAKDGSSAHVEPLITDTPLEGLRAAAPSAAVRYADGSDRAAAAALARSSDVAIVYARDTQGEGLNMPGLALDDDADGLIAAIAAANPKTVVVLMTGSAATMPWIGRVPAVLEAWYPGERGGHAIGRLLFGDVNPSGRLPLTFPVSQEHLPTAGSPRQWPGDKSRIDYSEGVMVGYRWFDERRIRPLFAFGHGLSYGGKFKYSSLRAASTRDGGATVSFRVTNTGRRRAAEVPQLYLGMPDPAPTVPQPPQVLRQFKKITLDRGRTQTVRLALDRRAFAYWNARTHGWQVAPGCYGVLVGSSSRDIRLRSRLARGVSARACPPPRSCLARRSPVGRRNLGRVRLGASRPRLRRLSPLTKRTRRAYRFCVKGGHGSVTATFTRRGRVTLIATTAAGHGNRRVRPRTHTTRLRKAYPNRRRIAAGLYRARKRSRLLIGTRRGRIRYIAVADRRLIANRRALKRHLRATGVAPKSRAR